MSERLRAMSERELAATLSSLDLAWPPTPDLAPVVMASVRASSQPRVIRLPLSRPKRILLIAAATLLLLAGVALAARFVIDLGAVVVEFTPGPLTQPTPTPGDPFGEALTIQEATAIFGDDLVLPERLGPPDRLWADEVFTDAGGKPLVEIYTIAGMGHGTPVDPGPGPEQCGRAGVAFILDAGICSGLQIARFWGLGNGNGTPVDRAKLLERLNDVQTAVDGLRNLIQQLP